MSKLDFDIKVWQNKKNGCDVNRRVNFTTNIDKELKRKLKVYTAFENVQQNEVIEYLLSKLFEQYDKDLGDDYEL